MKMSPMQKYAMRLLIASGQVRLPDRNAWTQLTSETAAEQCGGSAEFRPFSGIPFCRNGAHSQENRGFPSRNPFRFLRKNLNLNAEKDLRHGYEKKHS